MSKLFGREQAAKPHLVRGRGISGEVADLREDIDRTFDRLETGGGYFVTDEFTAPDGAVTDAIKTSIASATSITTLAATDLDGSVGNTEMVPPRNPTVTTTTHANIDAVPVVFIGRVRNADGDLVEHSIFIMLTNGGGVTDASTAVFSFIDTIVIPAQSGTGGALEFGFGDRIGLSQPIKARAGLVTAIREIEDGAVVTTGTFAAPGESTGPNGTYTPATAPDGSIDYAVTYEVDPSV